MEYQIIVGDSLKQLKKLKTNTIQTIITSPPYWALRDYQSEGQLGQEDTPQDFIKNLCDILEEAKRVLKNDGTLWLNLGDTYVGTGHKGEWKDTKNTKGRNGQTIALNNKVKGLKPKNMIGIPWRVAIELQNRGWILRQDIIWHKPNPMPESVKDRCTKAHEYIFLLTKQPKYYYDNESIKEKAITNGKGGLTKKENSKIKNTGLESNKNYQPDGKRNKRSVWSIPPAQYKEKHFAVYPEKLIEPCVLAGSKEGDIVLDIFSGTGTTGLVALKNKRKYIGIEINPKYAKMQKERLERLGGTK